MTQDEPIIKPLIVNITNEKDIDYFKLLKLKAAIEYLV